MKATDFKEIFTFVVLEGNLAMYPDLSGYNVIVQHDFSGENEYCGVLIKGIVTTKEIESKFRGFLFYKIIIEEIIPDISKIILFDFGSYCGSFIEDLRNLAFIEEYSGFFAVVPESKERKIFVISVFGFVGVKHQNISFFFSPVDSGIIIVDQKDENLANMTGKKYKSKDDIYFGYTNMELYRRELQENMKIVKSNHVVLKAKNKSVVGVNYVVHFNGMPNEISIEQMKNLLVSFNPILIEKILMLDNKPIFRVFLKCEKDLQRIKDGFPKNVSFKTSRTTRNAIVFYVPSFCSDSMTNQCFIHPYINRNALYFPDITEEELANKIKSMKMEIEEHENKFPEDKFGIFEISYEWIRELESKRETIRRYLRSFIHEKTLEVSLYPQNLSNMKDFFSKIAFPIKKFIIIDSPDDAPFIAKIEFQNVSDFKKATDAAKKFYSIKEKSPPSKELKRYWTYHK